MAEAAQPPDDDSEKQIEHMMMMFPDVQPQWIRQQFGAGHNIAQITEIILADADVPKIEKRRKNAPTAIQQYVDSPITPVDNKKKIIFAKPDNTIAQPDLSKIIKAHLKITEEWVIEFEESAVKRLSAMFTRISMASLRTVFKQARNNYSVAWAMLQLAARAQAPPIDLGRPSSMHTGQYQAAISWAEEVINVEFTVTKSKRSPGAARNAQPPSTALIEELQIVATAIKEGRMDTASGSNQDSTEDDSDQFECPICCCECAMGDVVRCGEDHMFCRHCLAGQANEVAFGQGQGQAPAGGLPCLEPTCDSHFSRRTLKKVLDVGLRSRLSEQNRERNLHAANLDNFERCRYCNWGACIDVPKEMDKVFRCQNQHCMADLCRLCGKDWDDDHIGKRCDEMIKNMQEKARKELEEKMSEAVIRKCPNCKTPFDKVEGCNKMTCRCGHTMCYLCREPKIDYNHFCPHPKEPNQTACPAKCGRCMLWEVAAHRDAKVLDEIQNQAKNDERLAGMAIGTKKKKRKKKKKNHPIQNEVPLPNRLPMPPVQAPPPPVGQIYIRHAPLYRPAMVRMNGPPPHAPRGYWVGGHFNQAFGVRPYNQN